MKRRSLILSTLFKGQPLSKVKKENLNNLFITVFFATLLYGDVAAQLQTVPLQIIYYFLGYFLALALVDKRLKTADYLSEQKVLDNSSKDKINVSGIVIETELEADTEENRFFRIIEQKSMINRQLFLLLYVVLLFFTYKAAPEDFHAYSLLPFVTAIFIALSATIGHLLIALFFNALYFTLNAKEISTFFIVTYIIFFLLTLIVFSLAFKEKLKPSAINYSTLMRNLLSGLVPLLFFITSIHYFTKKPLDLFSFNKINKLNHRAGELVSKAPSFNMKMPPVPESLKHMELSLDLNNLPKNIPNLAQANRQGKSGQAMPQVDIGQLPSMNLKIKNFSQKTEEAKQLVNQLEQSSTTSPADIEKLRSHIQNLKLELPLTEGANDNTPVGNDKISNEDFKKLIASMEGGVDKIQANPQGKKDAIKGMQNDLDKISKSLEARMPMPAGKPSEIAASNNVKSEKIAPTPKKPKPLINENLLKELLKMLKSLAIACMVFGALAFLNKFFKKTDYRDLKRVKTDPEAELILKNELNELKKLKLSPRDEIILYYELIYKIIKFYHFPDHEAPPPTETYQQVVHKHLSIQKQLYAVDEIFSRSFYGNHPVTNEQLATFRKSIPAILIRFGLKKKLF
jgi:peptidoglycan hydrolase CwlO-like protein